MQQSLTCVVEKFPLDETKSRPLYSATIKHNNLLKMKRVQNAFKTKHKNFSLVSTIEKIIAIYLG